MCGGVRVEKRDFHTRKKEVKLKLFGKGLWEGCRDEGGMGYVRGPMALYRNCGGR